MKRSLSYVLLLCFIIIHGPAAAEDRILNVGYWNERSEVSQNILQKYPSLHIIGGDMTAGTTDELISQFLTKEFSYDVFPLFSIQYDIQPLIEKGYLADLSGSDEVRDIVSKMKSDIVSMVSKGSGIYALPYGLETEFLSIQPEAWKNAGFKTEEIPDTFDAFLFFLDSWCKKPVPGFCVMGQFDETMYTENSYTQWLLELLFENYLMQYRYLGKTITFDDLSLKKQMEHCIATGKALYQIEKIPNHGYALLENRCSGVNDIKNLVSLRMNDEQPKLIKAYLWMVAVNADSTVQDLAVDFAIHVFNMDASISVLLYQEPHSVLNPNYNDTLIEYQNAIEEIEEKLTIDNLSTEKKLELQKTIDEYRAELEDYKDEKNRYYVTDLQIKEICDCVDGIFIEAPGPLSVGSEYGPFLNQLIASYAAGLSSTDQMISKLDEICWMIQMEEGL